MCRVYGMPLYRLLCNNRWLLEHGALTCKNSDYALRLLNIHTVPLWSTPTTLARRSLEELGRMLFKN